MGTEIGPLAVRRSIWFDAKTEHVWEEFATFDRYDGPPVTVS